MYTFILIVCGTFSVLLSSYLIILLKLYKCSNKDKYLNKDNDLNKDKDLNKNIVFNVTTKKLLLPFIYDKYAIQMRSLFALITIFLIKNNNKFYISIIYNSISLFLTNINIINLLLENKKLIYDNSEESKKMILKFDLLSSIPCLLDIITIIYVSDTIIQKTNLIVITILLGLTLFIKPFYNLNHILLHTLLIIQTICIIKCVLNVDYL
jgi:hypothetical protein